MSTLLLALEGQSSERGGREKGKAVERRHLETAEGFWILDVVAVLVSKTSFSLTQGQNNGETARVKRRQKRDVEVLLGGSF